MDVYGVSIYVLVIPPATGFESDCIPLHP